MNEPPTTDQLCETARLVSWQAADISGHVEELVGLVALTGVELSSASRRELATDLHDAVVALHTVQLAVCESQRGHLAES